MKSIIIIIGIVLVGFIFWYLGFFNKYNYFSAVQDINNKTPHKIIIGELLNVKEHNRISKKYGFNVIQVGCVVGVAETKGINIYNSKIDNYLNKKNGTDWNINYQNEIKTLNNCLTDISFTRVFERVMIRPSLTVIEYNNKKWKINFNISERKKREIYFSINGYSIGKITSNLKIYSLIKDVKNHEKTKREISEIFCKLNKWAQGDTSIRIDWTEY
ncbi:MAG: hypothetical protein L3J23_07335 [Flavobacteriaceae bacterium]|nr:hypothetical protein [Flavobacteriaceae bacterium]